MRKILIVDDDDLTHFVLSRALETLCDEIHTASTGREAVDQVTRSLFDLCLLDINLPDTSGIDLMMEIAKVSPETKIVMMSGGYVDDGMKELIYEKAHIFIPKPLDIFMVKKIVSSALKEEKA